MAYEHLRLEREAPSTERHPRRHPGIRPPADPRAHGAALAGRLDQARQRAMAEDVGGFDDRKLLKIRLRAGDKSVPAVLERLERPPLDHRALNRMVAESPFGIENSARSLRKMYESGQLPL